MNKPLTQSEIETGTPVPDINAQSKKALRKKLFVALLAGVTLCGRRLLRV